MEKQNAVRVGNFNQHALAKAVATDPRTKIKCKAKCVVAVPLLTQNIYLVDRANMTAERHGAPHERANTI